jgi:hypothetical protein
MPDSRADAKLLHKEAALSFTCSSGMLRHLASYIIRNVSKEYLASLFRAEEENSRFPRYIVVRPYLPEGLFLTCFEVFVKCSPKCLLIQLVCVNNSSNWVCSKMYANSEEIIYIRRAQVKVGLINLCKCLFSLNARIYYKLKSGT